MTFEDLKLQMAVVRYLKQPKSTTTEIFEPRYKLERAMQVRDCYTLLFDTLVFEWELHEVDKAVVGYRKRSAEQKVTVDVALAHGIRCFWADRGKGRCCDEVECGHLVPDSQGGPRTVANCIIECRSHNNQRREMTTEQYLRSDKKTD